MVGHGAIGAPLHTPTGLGNRDQGQRPSPCPPSPEGSSPHDACLLLPPLCSHLFVFFFQKTHFYNLNMFILKESLSNVDGKPATLAINKRGHGMGIISPTWGLVPARCGPLKALLVLKGLSWGWDRC